MGNLIDSNKYMLMFKFLMIPEIYIGENGNWYINGYDTGVKARGDDGITPHIGANGNWHIGETDTLVPATGPKGDPGVAGSQGIQGPKGEKGDQGPAGREYREQP